MNRSSSMKKTRMQALSFLLPQTFNDSNELTPISMKHVEDLNSSIKLENGEENFEEQEFSFSCGNPQGTLIFADEIFDNGQILPLFPFFDQNTLYDGTQNKKLFVEQHNDFPSKLDYKLEEPLNKGYSEEMTIMEVNNSHERCKKSSSTGFSKQLKIRRDMKLRSNSEGDDTFILMNPSSPTPLKQVKHNDVLDKNVMKKKSKEEENKNAFSAYEEHYRMRRTRKESEKRRSFIPYKQVMVGFFANKNIFSRNLHPF